MVRAPASKNVRLGRVLGFIVLADVVACGVEGVTPDCSDAAVCAPYAGDAAPSTDAAPDGTARDTGAGNDAAVADAQSSDATDAADEG